MKEISKIPAANEVVSALLAKKCVADKALLAALKNDPAETLDIRAAAVRVRTVQNTRDLLHVCVPDYGTVQELESSELEQLSGGFFDVRALAHDSYARDSARMREIIATSSS